MDQYEKDRAKRLELKYGIVSPETLKERKPEPEIDEELEALAYTVWMMDQR